MGRGLPGRSQSGRAALAGRAAFQLLAAATASPWGRADDPRNLYEEIDAQLTEGVDYMRRLMLGAYVQLARGLDSDDLRFAERRFFAEEMGDDLLSWLRDAGSKVTWRELV